MCDPHIDIIFNTAMIGDSKSLAGYLKALQEYFPIMGLYPTNELARDQMSQIESYIEKFSVFEWAHYLKPNTWKYTLH